METKMLEYCTPNGSVLLSRTLEDCYIVRDYINNKDHFFLDLEDAREAWEDITNDIEKSQI